MRESRCEITAMVSITADGRSLIHITKMVTVEVRTEIVSLGDNDDDNGDENVDEDVTISF